MSIYEAHPRSFQLRIWKTSGALVVALSALALIAVSPAAASYSASAGGEPAVTNTATDSHFFDWTAQGNMQFCVKVFRNSATFERGCVPSASTYYTDGSSGTFSQTENGLADGTLVGVYPCQYQEGTFSCLTCSFDFCHSSTLIDLNQPVLTVYAAGTATYTNNPQVPMHIDYFDALSHPWFAGGDGAAVFICARRDRPCTNADLHNYEPNCSHANLSRFSSPGTNEGELVRLHLQPQLRRRRPGLPLRLGRRPVGARPGPDRRRTVETPDPRQPVHQPGYRAGMDGRRRQPRRELLRQRHPRPRPADDRPDGERHDPRHRRPGDLQRLGQRLRSRGSPVPSRWDFGDNTPGKQGANITHTYATPAPITSSLTGHDGAGNEGSAAANIVVKTQGGTGEEGTVTPKAAEPHNEIGGRYGTQKATLGSLKVIAPKKHRLGKKPKPILLLADRQQPGAFQAALTKGPKIVSKGAGVLATAGTFGFKLKLPKRLGARHATSCGSPSSRTARPRDRRRRCRSPSSGRVRDTGEPARAGLRAAPGAEGPVNVDAGPPLAAGYGR